MNGTLYSRVQARDVVPRSKAALAEAEVEIPTPKEALRIWVKFPRLWAPRCLA